MSAECSRMQRSDVVGMMPITPGAKVLHVSGVAPRVRTASPYASHGGSFGLRRRSRQLGPTLRKPRGGSPGGEPQASEISNRRLSKTAWRTQIARKGVPKLIGRSIVAVPLASRRGIGLALRATDPMVGGSQNPLFLWRRITPASRVATLRAAGHRRRVSTASRRGGGNAFAALTVGSRRFVKQSTLHAII
jgi:hypothetical protein